MSKANDFMIEFCNFPLLFNGRTVEPMNLFIYYENLKHIEDMFGVVEREKTLGFFKGI